MKNKISFLFLMLAIGYVLTGCGKQYEYVMPNGVVCQRRITELGDLEFADCDDGQKYFNVYDYTQRTK